MKFNSVKRGNFSGLAGHVNKTMDQAFEAGRSTSVDHTAIAKESIKGRSLERRAAMKAEGKVAQAGLQAFAKTKDTKNKIESQQKIADIKRPAKRMAGIVGGLGAIAGGYVTMEGNKKDKAERAELRTYREQLDAKAEARDAERSKRDAEILKALQESGNGGSESSDPKPSTPAPTAAGSTKSAPISSGEALDSSKGSTVSGKLYSQTQMQSFAEQAGFSPENAKIMAAIGMGESRGNSGIDTVQSGLDPGKKNEYSIGLTQINVKAHNDKLTRRGWTAEDLRDPVKNLTIAKEVYDEVGSFKPWSVYTSGKYTDYLK
jgi:hypothetical protein